MWRPRRKNVDRDLLLAAADLDCSRVLEDGGGLRDGAYSITSPSDRYLR